MTPKEEEPLGTETPDPSPLAITLARPLSPLAGPPSVTVDFDSTDARLDNSHFPPDATSSSESSADNARETPLQGEAVSTHVTPTNDLKVMSSSPSKSDKSSSSNNDSSEFSSQRSVDSVGSSSDGVHMKESSEGVGDAATARPPETGPEAEAGDLPPRKEKRIAEPVPNLRSEPPQTELEAKEEESRAEADLSDDAFAAGGAASVFCTCASGHPFVVEPCSVSEMSTSVSSRSDDVEVTFSTSSHGVTIADESKRLFDGERYSLELEPNLHLPNERCNRSLSTEVGTDKVTPTCSNFASYGCEEEYFKNDFVQDLYPILSPQQMPFQVSI